MNQIADTQFIDALQMSFREGDENVGNKLEEAENVRRVEEIFHAIAAGNFEALTEIFADDITMEIVGSDSMPMTCRVQGLPQVIETTQNNFAQVEEQRPEILSVVAQGNTVVVIGREQGRFRPTGRNYDVH
jgi:ketosteroid isomerase-like protein